MGLRVAVNARFLLPRREGIGNYAHYVLQRMVAAHPDAEFIFFFDRPYDPQYVYAPNVRPVVLPPPARHPVLWWIWFEMAVARALRKYRPDAFFSPDSFAVLRGRVPTLTVFHDIGYETYHEDIPYWVRRYYQRYFPRYARHSSAVACVSEFTRQDLIRRYGVDAEKTFVAYSGPDPHLQAPPHDQIGRIRQRLTQGRPYFIYVGALHGRKNIDGMLRAFDRFKETTGAPHRLLIAGRKMWTNAAIEAAYQSMRHREAVVFSGWLEDEALRAAVAGAEALVLVSHFEGFGLPIAEAQALGTPVITSNLTAMPEIAGEGALLVDPRRPESIAQAMEAVLDPDVRTRLRTAGRQNVQRFSWDESARRIWNHLTKIAS